jgi:hypothetical protein
MALHVYELDAARATVAAVVADAVVVVVVPPTVQTPTGAALVQTDPLLVRTLPEVEGVTFTMSAVTWLFT